MKIKPILVLCLALICLLATSGCSSTRSENGVMIEKKGSTNPMNYIPFL